MQITVGVVLVVKEGSGVGAEGTTPPLRVDMIDLSSGKVPPPQPPVKSSVSTDQTRAPANPLDIKY